MSSKGAEAAVKHNVPIVRRRGGSITIHGEVREASADYDPTQEFAELLNQTSKDLAGMNSKTETLEVASPPEPPPPELPSQTEAAEVVKEEAEQQEQEAEQQETVEISSTEITESSETSQTVGKSESGRSVQKKKSYPIVRRDKRGSLKVEGGVSREAPGYDPTQEFAALLETSSKAFKRASIGSEQPSDKEVEQMVQSLDGASQGDGGAPLPIGWLAHVHKDTGKTFYHNSETGQSVWERPTAETILDEVYATYDSDEDQHQQGGATYDSDED